MQKKYIYNYEKFTAEIHRCTPVARTRYQQCPNKAVYVGKSLARAGDAFDASRNNGCGVLRDSIFSCESTAYVQYCPFHEWLVHGNHSTAEAYRATRQGTIQYHHCTHYGETAITC